MKTIKLWDGREIDAVALLVALVNRTSPGGTNSLAGAFFSALAPPFTREQAEKALEGGRFDFDYLEGRPLKIRARNGVIDEHSAFLYDRDAGHGAFERAVAEASK